MRWLCIILFLLSVFQVQARVQVGLDRLFQEEKFLTMIEGSRVGLISHHAAINEEGANALEVFLKKHQVCSLKVLFTLEHGFFGSVHADHHDDRNIISGIETVSLFNVSRIPEAALSACDVIVYDVQDIGVRSYTFISGLLVAVKTSAEAQKPLIILDRPNPLGGNIVDGPLPHYESKFEPIIPYCYGMTAGELALLFKDKYAPNAIVHVVPMKGWHRSMTFKQTGLQWIPTSPHIPEPDTALFYATTGLIGHISIVNIGVGYTLPFKVIGAPWVQGHELAQKLKEARLPGIEFVPFSFEPFYGKYKMEECSGVLLCIKDAKKFLPVETQFTILGVLKTLYPDQMKAALDLMNQVKPRKDAFCHFLGLKSVLDICNTEQYITWPLRILCSEGRKEFMLIREKYLLPAYQDE